MWYPGRPVRNALKEVTTAQGNEAVLNVQESAEVIVSRSADSTKDEGPNQQESLVRPGKEGRAYECRKHRKLLAER